MSVGGIADKLGNEFEGRWVALRLLTILTGRDEKAITLEPVTGRKGFEFALELKSETEWHQCKTRSTGGWTINRLHSEGVLADFLHKLSGDLDARCVFVTDQAASSLGGLCTLANRGEGFSDFEHQLTDSVERSTDFERLIELCSISRLQGFEALKRIRTEVVSSSNLERYIRTLSAVLFDADPQAVLDRLAGLSAEQLTHRLDTDSVRRLLRDVAGFQFKDYALDVTLPGRLDHANETFLAPIKEALPGLEIERTSLVEKVLSWYDNDLQKTLLLTGSAGTGKSQVLANTVAELRKRDVPVLAIRLDRYLDVMSTVQLGEAVLGKNNNPAHILGIAAESKNPPILILDQLDAVSDASGRRGALKDIALELISRVSGLLPYKVIIACRSYDLQNDQRFKRLSEDERTEGLDIPSLDWDDDLLPALLAAGYEVESFSLPLKTLLKLPSNLATFLRLDRQTPGLLDAATAGGLIDRLLLQTERTLTSDKVTWSLHDILGEMADHMSVAQSLVAPKSIVQSHLGAFDKLQSAGLITADGSKIRFTHESYFDHVFATRFSTSGQSVLDWLKSGEQHLFRRTQIRQILAFMRAQKDDKQLYLRSLNEALNGEGIRYLVRDAVARWMASVSDPVDTEFAVACGAVEPRVPTSLQKSIFSGSDWYPHIVAHGFIEDWLASDDDELAGIARALTSSAFRKYPDLAATQLRRLWSRRGDAAIDTVRRVIFFANPGDDPAPLVAIFEDLLDDPSFEIELSSTGSVFGFHGWEADHAGLAVRLVAQALEKLIDNDPGADPFIGNGMEHNKVPYEIRKLAERAPVEFLDVITPLFSRVLARIVRGETELDGRAADRMFTKSFEAEERWGGLLVETLTAAAVKDVGVASRFRGFFSPSASWMDLFYVLKAMSLDGPAANNQFADIIGHEHLFNADRDGDEWLPAAQAAKAVKPHLPTRDWHRFEERLFNHRPEHESALWAWNQSQLPGGNDSYRRGALAYLAETGLTQWRIIREIGTDAFSNGKQRQIAVLERKFDGQKSLFDEKTPGGWVRPPIPADRAPYMSDNAWQRAIEKYNGDNNHVFTSEGPVGGARELSTNFQAQVKAHPRRFVALFEKLADTTHSAYADGLLYGLRESQADTDIIIRGVHSTRRFQDRFFDSGLLMLIEDKPEIAGDDWVFDWLVNLVNNGDNPNRPEDLSDHSLLGSLTVDNLYERGNRLVVNGHGPSRLTAWLALANVARTVPGRMDSIVSILDERMLTESNSDVLPGLAVTVGELAASNRSWCLDAFEQLARRDLRIVAHYRSLYQYRWLVWQERPRFEWLTEQLIVDQDPALRTLGFFWQNSVAFQDGEAWPIPLDHNAEERRAIAKLAVNNLLEEGDLNRSLEAAMALSSDDDQGVVAELFGADWRKIFERGEPFTDLASALIESSYFQSQGHQLVYMLDDLAERFPDISMAAAHRILDAINANEGADDPHGERSFYSLGKLVVAVSAAHAERGITQSTALDLIDRFLELDSYSVRSEVEALDRQGR